MKSINELTANRVVYHIITEKVKDPKLEQEIGRELLFLIKSLMSQKEANSYIVISDEDEKEDDIFLFLNETKTLQIIDFLISKSVLKSSKEISMDILMDRVKSDSFKNVFSIEERHTIILDKFIAKNLTIDLVLDKINERGIESLNKIDYYVLKSL